MNKISISPEMSVSEVLERWPETTKVFLQNRTFCIGCSMSVFDTIAEAAQNYRIPIDEFIEQLEFACEKTTD